MIIAIDNNKKGNTINGKNSHHTSSSNVTIMSIVPRGHHGKALRSIFGAIEARNQAGSE